MSGMKKAKVAKKIVESKQASGYPTSGSKPGKGNAASLTSARANCNSNHGSGPSPKGPKSYNPSGT